VIADPLLLRETTEPVESDGRPSAIGQQPPKGVAIAVLHADACVKGEASVPARPELLSSFLRDSSNPEQRRENPTAERLSDLFDLLGAGRRSRSKAQTAVLKSERPVRDHQVPMDVQVDRRAESLDESQESGRRVRRGPGLFAIEGGEDVRQYPADLPDETWIALDEEP
jgi:hypothetical protein